MLDHHGSAQVGCQVVANGEFAMNYRPATDEDRKAVKRHHREWNRVHAERDRLASIPSKVIVSRNARGGLKFEVVDQTPPLPDYPAYPEHLAWITCGARTRAGHPCKQRDLYANCRCRWHGGLSTGPRTPEGKWRSSMNGLRPKRRANPMKGGKIQPRLTTRNETPGNAIEAAKAESMERLRKAEKT